MPPVSGTWILSVAFTGSNTPSLPLIEGTLLLPDYQFRNKVDDAFIGVEEEFMSRHLLVLIR